MEVSPFARSISSGAYNFLRWSGAAIAPALSGWIGQTVGMTIPFYIAAGVLLVGTVVLYPASQLLRNGLVEAEANRAQNAS